MPFLFLKVCLFGICPAFLASCCCVCVRLPDFFVCRQVEIKLEDVPDEDTPASGAGAPAPGARLGALHSYYPRARFQCPPTFISLSSRVHALAL